ncbi:MAG TPA: PLP-dependent aminotransferase family protein [Solirubrobacterales bacterium]|nr:PLP-dependent aminotransferase family protein [Solirubrobacterales bacterium]
MAAPPPPRRPQTRSKDLERYASLFAKRTRVMRSSAMRDMMAITARPEVISLAGGLPDTSTFPPEAFAAEMDRIAKTSVAEVLQYGPTEGIDLVREQIAKVMAAEDMRIDPMDVTVTTGGQQAIDLITKVLIDPGDALICDAPTYPGAIPTFCSYEADIIQIECDSDGMKIDILEQTLAELAAKGRKPKFIYSVPTFQNPGGATLSLERRHRLVALAREHEILVVEDNPYGLLRYEGDPLPTLYSLDGGNYVVYLGTFSKILSAGLRIGWIVSPTPIREKVVLGKAASDLCTSTLTQDFAGEYFKKDRWREYVDDLVAIYRNRRDAMVGAMSEYFPHGTTWTKPEGGLFVWATLPDVIDTEDLLAKALTKGVAFVPGTGAYVDGRGASSMRLNFSGVKEDEIIEGIRRIGKVAREHLALYETMTGTDEMRLPPRPEDPEEER